MHAHALWRLLRYRRSHHISFTSKAEDIYVFFELTALSKVRSGWLKVEDYETLSEAKDWISDHKFCLGILTNLLSWTVLMKYQCCVPRPWLNNAH
jgi:hypothetical protein